MKLEDLQPNSTFEEISDTEAAKINGGYASLEAAANALYQKAMNLSLSLQKTTAASKASKDQIGKVQA